MMSQNKQKVKGSRWEHDAVELLNKEFPDVWKRIPMSGALGTSLEISELEGDLRGKYYFFPAKLVAEAKVGYGGSHMQIQKEWFDKIADSAKRVYGLPIVLLKFEKSRSGVKHVVAMDFYTWDTLMTYIKELYDELEEIHEKSGQG
jgi:Holliday junction resolvase